MRHAKYGKQSTLFPEADEFTVYEQPLNERMRNCLRLEHLFLAIDDRLAGHNVWDARAALVNMLEISDLLARSDTKGELIKELERQMAILAGLRNNPGVDQRTLERTTAEIAPLLATLKSITCQPGNQIRNDELITQVRQRIAIPGGTCNFDSPAYHHWLHKDATARAASLQRWMDDLRIIQRSTAVVLRIVRDSTRPQKVTANDGFYQQQLDASLSFQLIRVIVATHLGVYPEISGGKHRFTVRFFRQPDTANRPAQAQEPVPFELQCCGM